VRQNDESLRLRLPGLIRRLQHQLVWKPGAAARHLLKRKLRGHLPTDSSLADYEALIRRLLADENAEIHVYYADETPFLAVATHSEGQVWLVIASFEGVMETAFVVENPDAYLNRPMFQYVGRLAEVMA
jgi:hypothetical protein